MLSKFQRGDFGAVLVLGGTEPIVGRTHGLPVTWLLVQVDIDLLRELRKGHVLGLPLKLQQSLSGSSYNCHLKHM